MPVTIPSREDDRAKERRQWIGVVIAVALVAAGAGAYFLRAPQDAKLAAVGPAMPRLPTPPIPGLDAMPQIEDRLPRAAQEELAFGDMLDILGAQAEHPQVKPLAEQFKKTFMASSRTRTALEEFKAADKRGDRPKAADFVALLRRMPEFKAMASQFAFQSGASSAMLALAQGSPELKKFLVQQKKLLAAAKNAGQQSSIVASTRGKRTASLGGGLAYGGNTTFTTNRSGVSGHSAAATSPQSGDRISTGYGASQAGLGVQNGAAGAGGNSIGGGGAQTGGGASAGASPTATDTNPKTGATPGTLPTSGPGSTGGDATCTDMSKPECQAKGHTSETMDSDLKAWLQKHGISADDFLNDKSDDGLWGYCFKNNLLAKCTAACNDPVVQHSTTKRITCRPVDGYEGLRPYTGCIEWKGGGSASEVECLGLCFDQKPDCANPQSIVKRYCESLPMFMNHKDLCLRIGAADARGVWCGDAKKCGDNKQVCEAANYSLTAKPKPTCPYGTQADAAAAVAAPKCEAGKSPWMASDCTSFEQWAQENGEFSKQFIEEWTQKGFTEAQAKERWVYERNKDLDADKKKEDAKKWRDGEFGKGWENRYSQKQEAEKQAAAKRAAEEAAAAREAEKDANRAAFCAKEENVNSFDCGGDGD